MNAATTIRRLTVAALAVAGLATVAAPAANADVLTVRTDVSVPSPYPVSALLPGLTIDEAKGPVMLNVRHTITCKQGTVRRRGYPAMCQWSSALWAAPGQATVAPHQGEGDVYAAGVDGRPQGDNFHAGTLGVGGVGTDNWAVVVRGDELREADEVFHMSVSASQGGSVTRNFTIRDDDSRK